MSFKCRHIGVDCLWLGSSCYMRLQRGSSVQRLPLAVSAHLYTLMLLLRGEEVLAYARLLTYCYLSLLRVLTKFAQHSYTPAEQAATI